jgi:hypothetical protein
MALRGSLGAAGFPGRLAAAYLPGPPPLTKARMALPLALRWERGWWFLRTFRPGLLARITGVPKGWRPTVEEQRFIEGLQESFFPTKPKQLGVVFDSLVLAPRRALYPGGGVGVRSGGVVHEWRVRR